MVLNVKEMNCKVILTKQETHDTISFVLKVDKDFRFVPGQFVTAYLNINGKVYPRPYSIVSTPDKRGIIELVVKKVDKGVVSHFLCDHLNKGDLIKIKGPYGLFKLDENFNGESVFIGAGSGVAPLMCFVRCLNKTKNKFSLFYTNKTVEDIIYYEELKAISLKNKRFNLLFFVTRPNDSETRWSGEIGRIDYYFLKNSINIKSMFYLCGGPKFVSDIEYFLIKLGVPKQNIKKEQYD